MEKLVQDVRYGLRTLARTPGFTAVAVFTLALGIGANTAIFTLINAVMLKSLPVTAPRELAVVGDPLRVHSRSMGSPQVEVASYPLYRELRDRNQVFTGLLASSEVHRVRVTDAQSEDISTDALGVLVSGNYFSVLGEGAARGRTLTPEDDSAAGAHPVAVVSYSFWKNQLKGDESVVGQTVRLNNYPFTIVGVTEPSFYGDTVGDLQQIWVPITMQPQMMPGRVWLENANASWVHMIGRLRPGIGLDQARANINFALQNAVKGPFGASMSSGDRENLQTAKMMVSSGTAGFSALRGGSFKSLLVLMGLVVLVMGIACVNVANLLLARASARQREMAVRLALGAGSGRVMRQLLTESLMLAMVGGVVGLVVAQWGTRGLLLLSRQTGLESSPDWRVLAFTAAVCVFTGIAFGLAPALRLRRVELTSALKTTARQADAARAGWSWGKGLVAAQVALSLLVLFAAGLLVRTVQNCVRIDLGYSHDQLLMVSADPTAAGYKEGQMAGLAAQITDRFASLPGVRSVAWSKNGLFSGSESGNSIKVEGFQPKSDADSDVDFEQVGPGYFVAMGIPMLLGRDIGPQDTATSAKVVMINQTMARFYFGNANPIGRRIMMDDPQTPLPMEIAGVVRDVRSAELREEIPRRMYIPAAQLPPTSGLIFAVRTAGDPAPVADAARRQIRELNSSIPVISVRTLDDLLESTLSNERLLARLSSLFAALALILACIGLYGILSYAVAGRTREIGVRMALGSSRGRVLWLVLREALVLVVAGVLVGIPVAMLSSRLLSTMLYGVKGTDLISMALVISLLTIVAILAGLIPARRATRVDPMVALRYE